MQINNGGSSGSSSSQQPVFSLGTIPTNTVFQPPANMVTLVYGDLVMNGGLNLSTGSIRFEV